MQHHGRILAEVIKHRRGFVKEQRQVVFDAGGGHAIAHIFVDAAPGRVAGQQFAPAAAEFGARGIVHRKLAARQQAHLRHRVQAALAVGVKGADAVDLVVKQVHAVRHWRAHGENINQATAHRVFARADNLGDVAVAGQCELRFQARFIELLPDLELEGVARQKGGRRQAIQRGGGRHDDHVRAGFLVALLNPPQRGQPLADQVLVRRETVIGQGFPVGEQRAAQGRREKSHLVHQALGGSGVRCNDGGKFAGGLLALPQLGQQQGIG